MPQNTNSHLNLNNPETYHYIKSLNEISSKIIKIETQIEQLAKIEETLKGINETLKSQSVELQNIKIDQAKMTAQMPQRAQWFQVTTGLSAIGALIVATIAIFGNK